MCWVRYWSKLNTRNIFQRYYLSYLKRTTNSVDIPFIIFKN